MKFCFLLLLFTSSAVFAAGHWARTTPTFKLQVVDSVTSDWDDELANAVRDWSASEVLDLEIVAGTETSACTMIPGTVRVCSGAYGLNGWMGLASYSMDGYGHLVAATVQINDSYSAQWLAFPGLRQHVMCHELGHTLGLAHADYVSCMNNSSSEDSQWPAGQDYQTLLSIYKHTDSYNSYGGATAPAPTPEPAPVPAPAPTPKPCKAKGGRACR